MYYLKAHSADPPPCQRVLQSGWPDDVLSHGSASGSNFSFWTSVRKLRAALERTSIHFRSCFKECAHFLVRAPAGNLPEYLHAKFGQTHYEQDLVIVDLQLLCFFNGFSVNFEPAPTSRALLGEQSEAL